MIRNNLDFGYFIQEYLANMIHVGISFFENKIFYFNDDDKKVAEIKVEKVLTSEFDNADSVLKAIKQTITAELGYISILLPANFGNDIRKKLRSSCLEQGFKEVAFLDLCSASFMNAVSQSGFKFQNGEILWIFHGTKCFVWKKIKNKAALIGIMQQEILEKANLEEIKRKSKENKNPKYILCNMQLNKCLLRQISPDVQIFYYRSKQWGNSTVIKSRIMAGDPEVIDYDTNAVSDLIIIAKIGEKRIMNFFNEISAPLTKAIHIELNDDENDLSIWHPLEMDENLKLPTFKEFVLTVTVDTMGIYDIHYHKPSVTKKTLDTLYIEAENYICIKNLKYFIPQQTKNYSNEMDAVGIDLGGSKCCAAVNRRSGLATIPLDNTGERHLPSYIAFEEKHDKCGKIVVDRLRYYAKSAVYDTKQIIGKKYDELVIDETWPFKLVRINNNPAQVRDNHFTKEDYYTMIQLYGHDGEMLKYPEEIAAILLKYIKEKTEEFQGKKLNEATITIPTTFTDIQKKATYVAAQIAGWKKIHLLSEPIAAIFGYSKDMTFSDGTKVLIFDLGGTTLNIYVIKIENNQIIIKTELTNLIYAGKNFDNILNDYFSQKLASEFGIYNIYDRKYKLMAECQKIKEDLSTMNDATIDVVEYDPSKEGYITISRDQFEELSSVILAEIKTIITEALQKSDYQISQIDKVLQVGGGCRMPMIKKLLQDIFPEAEHCSDKHHDEIVAIGAALFAYNKNKDKTSINTTDLDSEVTTPHSPQKEDLNTESQRHEICIAGTTNVQFEINVIKPLKSNITLK